MVRVLIVGAGVTGSLCAYMIRKQLPSKLQCQIVVWEKSRGIGGRMSAKKHPNNPESMVELGAQYITPMERYRSLHQDLYNDLKENGILKTLTQQIEGLHSSCKDATNLISPTGLNAIPKYFFAKSLSQVFFQQKMKDLRLKSHENSSWTTWEAFNEDGHMDTFDAVIMTIPLPQVKEINEESKFLSENEVELLDNVTYSSRYALGIFCTKYATLPNYCAKYVKPEESTIIRYVSFDNIKRGDDKNGLTIAIHSSKEFGKENMEMERDEVKGILYKEFQNLYPNLLPSDPGPEDIVCHKWRYSQVSHPLTNSKGYVEVKSKPLLVLAGDGFTHSNFDGCIESARAASEHFVKWCSDN